MGMTLIPRSQAAETLDYNWSGWSWIRDFCLRNALEFGIDTTEIDGVNDGRLIKGITCKRIANAIEAHQDEYNAAFGSKDGGYGEAPALEHAQIWRNSGGMRQH